MSDLSPIALLVDADGNAVEIVLDGGVYRLSTISKVKNVAGTIVNPATEDKLEAVRVLIASLDGKDFATQTTLATLATESKLEAVRVLLNSLDGKDYATQTTLATLATESTLAAANALLTSIDGKDFATQTTLAAADTKLAAIGVLLTSLDGKDYATETTLSSANDKLGTIDGVLDSIKDTDGIKKITDALPAGTNEIGKVAQGTKAVATAAWPFYLTDSAGNVVGVVLDDTIYRLQADAKIAKKRTAGTLEHLEVNDDTGTLRSTLYTQQGDPISFPGIASDPSGIVNDFARQSGGADDADLRVDGSSTPVDFAFDALGSEESDLSIQTISFVMVANSIVSGSAKFAGLVKLTNGVKVISDYDGTETVIAELHENEDFIHFSSAGGYGFWALNRDQVSAQFFVSGAVVLHAGHSDSVIIRIADDIDSGIDYFKCFIKAVRRGG